MNYLTLGKIQSPGSAVFNVVWLQVKAEKKKGNHVSFYKEVLQYCQQINREPNNTWTCDQL